MGPLNRSFVSVVKKEGPRRKGVVPVRRWAREVICECPCSIVDWAEVRHSIARLLGQKGMVSISPFTNRK